MREQNSRRHKLEANTRPAGINRRQDVQEEHSLLYWKRVIGIVFLAPLALVTAVALWIMLWRALRYMDFWKSGEFIWFTIGGLSWAAAWLCGARPIKTYVFGHEMSHLVTARLFGGKIFDWKVTAHGGYVETDKSNTWITLAPYLVPFYTVIVMGVFGIASMFIDLHAPVAVWRLDLVPVNALYYLIGFTWWFHATYTAKTVHIEQGDLKRNGEFFSMMLIFLINVLLLILMFLASSPSPGLGFGEVMRCWWGVARDLIGWLPFL